VAPAADPGLLYWTQYVLDILERAGIEHALGEVTEIGGEFKGGPGPWVVRADGFAHKTASGVIRVGVVGSELTPVFEQLIGRCRSAGIEPRIRIAPFVAHDHELIVSLWRNRDEGDGCMLGQGGTSVERTTDVAISRLPSSRASVQRLLQRTIIGRRLLSTDPQAADAITTITLALAQVFAGDMGDLQELECNPIALAGSRAIVLDVLPTPTVGHVDR
jgi:hypothetical protein